MGRSSATIRQVWNGDGTTVDAEERRWLQDVGFRIVERMPGETNIAIIRAEAADEREYCAVLSWQRIPTSPVRG
jgi:hypothetical protein